MGLGLLLETVKSRLQATQYRVLSPSFTVQTLGPKLHSIESRFQATQYSAQAPSYTVELRLQATDYKV